MSTVLFTWCQNRPLHDASTVFFMMSTLLSPWCEHCPLHDVSISLSNDVNSALPMMPTLPSPWCQHCPLHNVNITLFIMSTLPSPYVNSNCLSMMSVLHSSWRQLYHLISGNSRTKSMFQADGLSPPTLVEGGWDLWPIYYKAHHIGRIHSCPMAGVLFRQQTP